MYGILPDNIIKVLKRLSVCGAAFDSGHPEADIPASCYFCGASPSSGCHNRDRNNDLGMAVEYGIISQHHPLKGRGYIQF